MDFYKKGFLGSIFFICLATPPSSQGSFETAKLCTELEISSSQHASNPKTASLAWNFTKTWEAGSTIRIKFIGGTDRQRALVKKFANDWLQVAHINFDFVSSGETEIRVAFARGAGHWSYIGTDALGKNQSEATLNIDLSNSSSESEYRRVALHEFGHALGFIHEHQHPDVEIPWDKNAVYAYYQRTHSWPKASIDHNILKKYSVSQLQWGDYDAESIMHYSIPNFLTLGNFEIGWNSRLSAGDRRNARLSYPRPSDYSPYWTTAGSGSQGWKVGDFNGDGKDDILRFLANKCSSQVLLSNGEKFKKSGCWTTAGSGNRDWHVGDFDGDGADDLMRLVNGVCGAQVYLSNGNSFKSSGCWTTAGDGVRGWHVGDFNGDGADDLMRFVKGVCSSQVLLSNPHTKKFRKSGCWTSSGDGDRGWHVGDFNGDGKADLLRSKGSCKAGVQLSNGRKFVPAPCWSHKAIGTSDWILGDFNGDSKTDIATVEFGKSGAMVNLSNGSGFEKAVSWTAAEPDIRLGGWTVGDFDGDGRYDVFRALRRVTGANMFLSEGDRFSEFR